MFRQEGVRGKVSPKTTAAKDNWSVLLGDDSSLLIFAAYYGTTHDDEVEDASFVDNPRSLRCFRELLKGLHQGVSDGHPRESLLTAVAARNRVTTHARNERKIQFEFV